VTKTWEPSKTKVTSLDALPDLLGPRRAAGERIVLTNGAFDLFHAGHLKSLEAARALGELLVVGVNSDVSIRAYKAPDRPVLPERERAALVAGLACVDVVVIFGEPTADRLVEVVRPDIYVKGADYAAKELPERAAVEAHGGRIVLIELEPGHSTSSLIDEIVRRFGG
jgi:rfaE bifunctional protein nucleotidyltransferase chain/domain